MAALLLLLLICPLHSQARMNVLFIGSDDLRPNLGAYSEVAEGPLNGPAMHTPALDQLAGRSMVFERAYVQQALCSPSRSSLMTGRRPDTTHVTDLETWFREAGGNFTTIPQFFKQRGYRSINVGKMFHQGVESSGPGGFRKCFKVKK
jgi:iduronate 2-sulfatase